MNDLFLHREMAKDLQKASDSIMCAVGTWRFFYNQANPQLVEALEIVNGQLEEQNKRIQAIVDECNEKYNGGKK